MKAGVATISRVQVEQEKTRVYAPLNSSGEMEWKELNAALCRVMQNYCGEYKNEELLQIGLIWLEDLQKNEGPRVCADNPHKLMRTLEVFNILMCDEIILHSSMARKASSQYLDFFRLDFPEIDPPEWHQWVTVKREDGTVKTGELPIDFWGPLKENYEKHR